MAQCTKAGGWTAKPMVKAVSSMLMVMYMTERGSMIRLMVMVSIAIWMGLNTKVIGRKISSMVKVLRHGQMEPNTMEPISMERSMEQVDSHGLMEALTLETLKTITFRVMELTIGLMVECLWVHG
jgi:hypothetical protein